MFVHSVQDCLELKYYINLHAIFFIQFADGKRSWRGLPGELEDILEDTEYYVDLIALGEEEDYYIKLSNGKEFWNIPSRLADRLRGKHAEKTVAGVSLGYEDQYNVRFTGRGHSSSRNDNIC